MGTIPKNMPTNFQLKRLKLKLDIVEKPENRVHKLTDSNGAPLATNMETIPKNMATNFQLKRLKLKLDIHIVEKPENRVHKLTDSDGARTGETFQTRKIDPNWQNCC